MPKLTARDAMRVYAKYLVNACPECNAPVGKMCKRTAGVWIHLERFRLYQNSQSNLYKTADLHEKTVQKAARGSTLLYSEKLPGKKARRKRNSRVEKKHWSDGLDALIVQYVRDNKIHYTRVEIIRNDAIIIHN